MLNNIFILAQAQAQAETAAQPGWVMAVPIILFGVMIFVMFRSQKKQAAKRTEMLSKIKSGDRVVTNGGIKGKITKVKDQSYLVEIADKVVIEVVKNGVSALMGENNE